MKISVENLGTIKKGEISLDKDLTIFTGENNSGKSYMSYLCYGILKDIVFNEITILRLLERFVNYSIEYSNHILLEFDESKKIGIVQGCPTEDFYEICFTKILNIQSTKVEFDGLIDKNIFDKIQKLVIQKIDYVLIENYNFKFVCNNNTIRISCKENIDIHTKRDVIFKYIYQHILTNLTLFIPAERTAINMFYLNIVRQEAISKNKKSLAPLAISDYIYFCYDFREHILNPSTEFADLATELENLLGGGVGVSGFGDLQFQPTKQENQIPLYLSSSLVKSWSGVVIYLRHLAQKGDILMIDEPEINLHPKSQVLIARFLAKMVNRGIRIVVSTHSDYILRELSTLIILNRDFEGKTELLQRYNYQEDNTLSGEKVAVYHFGNQTITNIPITNKGIETDSIDEVISRQNEISDMVYYSYLDTLPEQK